MGIVSIDDEFRELARIGFNKAFQISADGKRLCRASGGMHDGAVTIWLSSLHIPGITGWGSGTDAIISCGGEKNNDMWHDELVIYDTDSIERFPLEIQYFLIPDIEKNIYNSFKENEGGSFTDLFKKHPEMKQYVTPENLNSLANYFNNKSGMHVVYTWNGVAIGTVPENNEGKFNIKLGLNKFTSPGKGFFGNEWSQMHHKLWDVDPVGSERWIFDPTARLHCENIQTGVTGVREPKYKPGYLEKISLLVIQHFEKNSYDMQRKGPKKHWVENKDKIKEFVNKMITATAVDISPKDPLKKKVISVRLKPNVFWN